MKWCLSWVSVVPSLSSVDLKHSISISSLDLSDVLTVLSQTLEKVSFLDTSVSHAKVDFGVFTIFFGLAKFIVFVLVAIEHGDATSVDAFLVVLAHDRGFGARKFVRENDLASLTCFTVVREISSKSGVGESARGRADDLSAGKSFISRAFNSFDILREIVGRTDMFFGHDFLLNAFTSSTSEARSASDGLASFVSSVALH